MFTKRANQITPSPTSVLNAKVSAMLQQGIDVVKMNIGEPDFNTPTNIKEAAKAAIDANFTHYTTPTSGITPLRKAICKKLAEQNGLNYADDEICVTTGAKQALYETLLVLAEEGDEVIIPTPCWVSYEDMTKLAGATPVLVETKAEGPDCFHLNFDAICAAINSHTKAIIVCTPNNPTGVVYGREELERLVDLSVKNNFWIISDEVYEQLVYDGYRHVSTASLSDEAWAHTITINGCSKTYAMTGWRVGYAAAPQALIKKMQGIQGHVTAGINSISQKAALEAFSGSQEAVVNMREEFALRRKMMLKRLNAIPGITCADAQGAFYLMPNVSSYYGKQWEKGTITDSIDMADYLLEKAKIAVVAGVSFHAPNHLRLAYSNSMDRLDEGLSRMEEALADLQ